MADNESKAMIAVPLQSLVPGMQVPVDLFVSLNETRFVMIFKAGIVLDSERAKEFDRRGVKELFVRKEDYSRFFNRQIMIAGIVVQHAKINEEQKLGFVHVAGELILRELESMGFSGESYEAARDTAKSILTLVSSEPNLAKLITRFNQTASNVFNHSMAVGLVAVMIGRSIGWTRPETLEKLALGGILHDIGLQEISPAVVAKARTEMSYEELKEYESHSFRGMQILQGLGFVPDDVVAIAYEHHENSIGQGYPRRLWDMKINPLARIIALADTFCDLTLVSPSNQKPKTPEEALWHIETVMGQPFNKEAFKNFKSLLRAPRAGAA